MRKRTKVILLSSLAGVLVLGGAAAIAGPIVYRDLIVGEVDAPPTVAATPSATQDAGGGDVAVPALDGEWAVQDGSYAGYRVDEVLNGTDVTVVGRTEKVTGSLTVDGLTLTDAVIEVDVASIETDSANRDSYFRDTAMRASTYPTATFRLTEPVVAAQAPAAGQPQTITASGELTMAGQTRAVTVDLQAVWNGEGGQVAGSIPVTFADFGVEAPNLGFVSVEPTGAVEFSLVIQRP